MKQAFDTLKKYIIKTALKLGGFKAWLMNVVLTKVFKIIQKFISDLNNLLENKQEEKQNLDQYKEVINDKNSSADDIAKAGNDFLTK